MRKRIAVGDLNEVTNAEDDIPTEESYNGEWEEKLLSEFKTNSNDDAENDSDDDEQPTDDNTLHTYETLLSSLKEARHFALVKDDDYLGPIEHLILMTEKKIVHQKLNCTRHQSNLDNFFLSG